jgi:hypothetical protein
MALANCLHFGKIGANYLLPLNRGRTNTALGDTCCVYNYELIFLGLLSLPGPFVRLWATGPAVHPGPPFDTQG